jgi:hypothetical protein
MADERMIARLAETPEFAELCKWYDEDKERYFTSLSRKLFENPDALKDDDVRYKRERYVGMQKLLEKPAFFRDKLKKETNV